MNPTVTFLKPSLLIRAEAGGLSVAVKAAAPVAKPATVERPAIIRS